MGEKYFAGLPDHLQPRGGRDLPEITPQKGWTAEQIFISGSDTIQKLNAKLASQAKLIEEIKKIAGLYTTFYVSRADEKSCAIKISDLIAKAEKEI